MAVCGPKNEFHESRFSRRYFNRPSSSGCRRTLHSCSDLELTKIQTVVTLTTQKFIFHVQWAKCAKPREFFLHKPQVSGLHFSVETFLPTLDRMTFFWGHLSRDLTLENIKKPLWGTYGELMGNCWVPQSMCTDFNRACFTVPWPRMRE